MPELPEIDVFRHHIEVAVLYQSIQHVEGRDDCVLEVSAH